MSAVREVRLGDVVKVIGGGTPSRANPAYYGGDIPWVTPKDMKSWSIVGAQVNITREGLDNSSARMAPENSILVVVRSGVLKHTVPIGLNRVPVAINQDMKAVICGEGVHPDYLARALKARSGEILSWVRATTADNFPIDKLKELKVVLPPLAEQRRIADVLDRVDTLRAWRQQAVAELDALASSVFTELLDEVLNSFGCTSRNLGDVADIASGITKGRKAPAGSVREVPYLAVANVQDRRLDLSGIKYIEATDGEVERYRLRMNDLVLTEGGDPDKLGRGSLWRCELPEAIHQNHIFRVRIDDAGRVHPVYLNWLISSAYGKRYFLRSAKQTTGIASINMSQLRRFPVAVPDYDVQKKFAEQVDGIERSKAVQRRALGELDALFASLQHRAFRGEL
ncbi:MULTISPECIES: restriction endonuclease subunit S [unclassified Micromonospora]|uniref:restriction endonuclease subunit S n=1 Tax=unclassified Micromonospora TaxID=2617518 RepID=UPI003A84C9D6